MKTQYITLDIEKIATNGKGLGTFTDLAGNVKQAEVPFCMPGDRVETEIKRKKRAVFSGPLLQVVQSSPERVAPRCIHFGSCGGCSSQEIPYQSQLKIKEEQIAAYFTQQVLPIIPCVNPWGYRNKMEFSFSQDRQGQRFLGLFLESGRGKVFNVQECHLVSPWFAEVLRQVRAWWETTRLQAYYPPTNCGSLRTLTLREGITSQDRMAILTVSGNPDYALHHPEMEQWRALFNNESLFLRIHQAIKGQPTQFFEMHLQGPETIRERLTMQLDHGQTSTIDFNISPSAFFQPNTRQAERLYSTALQLAELSKNDLVYDLFCGTGTLGLLAARFVKKVVGIEISPEAALDARQNAKNNGIDNIEIITGAVGDILLEKERFPTPDLILLDPPRSGLDPGALKQLLALNSPKVVYISCNPQTQARDVHAFLEAGYTILAIQPVDQFPHTPHIENIVVLKSMQKIDIII